MAELWTERERLDAEIVALEEAAITKGIVKRDEDDDLRGDWQSTEEMRVFEQQLDALCERQRATDRAINQTVPSSVMECAIWLRALTEWVDFEDYERNQQDIDSMVLKVADVLEELSK